MTNSKQSTTKNQKPLTQKNMTLTFSQFKEQLNPAQLDKILVHFNDIYECAKLEDHELKICYLAYLWKNKEVVFNEFGYEIPNAAALGIDVEADFTITFEDEDAAGFVNLGLLHDYYVFIKLEELV